MNDKTVFISAPFGTSLDPLLRVIKDLGWAALNQDSVLPGALTYLNQSMDLIRSADAFIAVLPDQSSSETLVEIGFALGMRRPSFLIASDAAVEDEGFPDRILSGLRRLNAKIDDEKAIRFHLPAFFDSVTMIDQPVGLASEPPTMKNRSEVSSPASSQSFSSHLEQEVWSALSVSEEITAVRHQPKVEEQNFIPDFAIWVSDQSHALGNPMLVEVKAARNINQSYIEKMERFTSDAGLRSFLLIQQDGPEEVRIVGRKSLVFWTGLSNFKQLAERGRLIETLRRERNKFEHSAG